jgi:hypothetical protein
LLIPWRRNSVAKISKARMSFHSRSASMKNIISVFALIRAYRSLAELRARFFEAVQAAMILAHGYRRRS